MKKKTAVFSLCAYILSALFLACGILSVIACHQNISDQLSRGISIIGNELPIINLYLQSAVPYLAYAALSFLGGWLCRLHVPTEPEQVNWTQTQESDLPSDEENYYQIHGERRDKEFHQERYASM